jgi:hypothetical protein
MTNDPSAGNRFFGNALMAAGALVTVLCGGCTAIFLGGIIWGILTQIVNHGPLRSAEISTASFALLSGVGVVGIFGGLPTAAGVALFLSGRRMKRRTKAPTKRDLDNTFS